MTKLIIDATTEKIFFMILDRQNNYNISYENSKSNYEKLVELIINFLKSKDLDLSNISKIYVNRGPGSFAGIRNSLSIVKALHFVNKIDYFEDVNNAQSYLLSKDSLLIDKLKTEINKAVKKLDFEKAAEVRDRLKRLNILREEQSIVTRAKDVDIFSAF